MPAYRELITRQEAAERLSISLSTFKRHVQPHLSCRYVGNLRMYRPADVAEFAGRRLDHEPVG